MLSVFPTHQMTHNQRVTLRICAVSGVFSTLNAETGLSTGNFAPSVTSLVNPLLQLSLSLKLTVITPDGTSGRRRNGGDSSLYEQSSIDLHVSSRLSWNWRALASQPLRIALR